MTLVLLLFGGGGDGGGGGVTPDSLPTRALIGSVLVGTHSVNPKAGPNPGG